MINKLHIVSLNIFKSNYDKRCFILMVDDQGELTALTYNELVNVFICSEFECKV